MSEEPPLRIPTDDDPRAWKTYWTRLGMPWRTEPEISEERQRFLARRRAIEPNIARGIYPFRTEHGNTMLTRADVEWLIAASRPWLGPVGWDEERERARLQQLSYDKARVQAQLDRARSTITDAHERTTPRLTNLDDYDIRIQGGIVLCGADLAHVDLHGLELVGADLRFANLAGTSLVGCDLEEARLDSAILREADMRGANLLSANLRDANLSGTDARDAYLCTVDLRGATLRSANLRGASLENSALDGADLRQANLFGANLNMASLDGADLRGADLTEVNFGSCSLDGANLRGINLDAFAALRLVATVLHSSSSLPAVQWAEIPLGALDWDEVFSKSEFFIGADQEHRGLLPQNPETGLTTSEEMVVRNYSQLAATLREQGLQEYAERCNRRAQTLRLELEQWLAKHRKGGED